MAVFLGLIAFLLRGLEAVSWYRLSPCPPHPHPHEPPRRWPSLSGQAEPLTEAAVTFGTGSPQDLKAEISTGRPG